MSPRKPRFRLDFPADQSDPKSLTGRIVFGVMLLFASFSLLWFFDTLWAIIMHLLGRR
jgi:hypothetical protein